MMMPRLQSVGWLAAVVLMVSLAATSASALSVQIVKPEGTSFETTANTDIVDLEAVAYDAQQEDVSDQVTWSWDFGDGETSDLNPVLHVFRASGTLLVTVTAALGGTSASAQVTAVVAEGAIGGYTFSGPVWTRTGWEGLKQGPGEVVWDTTPARNTVEYATGTVQAHVHVTGAPGGETMAQIAGYGSGVVTVTDGPPGDPGTDVQIAAESDTKVLHIAASNGASADAIPGPRGQPNGTILAVQHTGWRSMYNGGYGSGAGFPVAGQHAVNGQVEGRAVGHERASGPARVWLGTTITYFVQAYAVGCAGPPQGGQTPVADANYQMTPTVPAPTVTLPPGQ